MLRAMPLAKVTSSVDKKTLKAINKSRAPMTQPPAGPSARGPKSGCGGAPVGDPALQQFIAAASDIREIAVRLLQRRMFIEKYRQPQLGANSRSQPARQADALFHVRAAQGNEGNDISRANAWMLPMMLVEVD